MSRMNFVQRSVVVIGLAASVLGAAPPTASPYRADSAGVIHACWLDTRNSPDDSSFHDVYASFATDGGLTFAPNARVTQSKIDTDSCWWIGDYIGIAADGGVAHPVWNTGGAPGVGSLQTATLALP